LSRLRAGAGGKFGQTDIVSRGGRPSCGVVSIRSGSWRQRHRAWLYCPIRTIASAPVPALCATCGRVPEGPDARQVLPDYCSFGSQATIGSCLMREGRPASIVSRLFLSWRRGRKEPRIWLALPSPVIMVERRNAQVVSAWDSQAAFRRGNAGWVRRFESRETFSPVVLASLCASSPCVTLGLRSRSRLTGQTAQCQDR
jgi:hypothetical protein